MKRSCLIFLCLVTILIGSSCGKGTSATKTFINIPLPLTSLVTQTQSLSLDLPSSGNYAGPIQIDLNSAAGIFNMVDSFFDFINSSQLPEGQSQIGLATTAGFMLVDFSHLTTVDIDIDGDGTPESITCSRTSSVPVCALMWLYGKPFAMLVLTAPASGDSLGGGYVSFVSDLVFSIATGTKINAFWNTSGTSDLVRVFYSGRSTADINATIAAVSLSRDRSGTEPTFIMQQSGSWQSVPISGCTESEALLGWVNAANYMSAGFNTTNNCTLPDGKNCILLRSGSKVTDNGTKCTVSLANEDYISLPISESLADFPSTFPPTPTF